MRRAHRATAILAVALLLAACGSDGDSMDDAGPVDDAPDTSPDPVPDPPDDPDDSPDDPGDPDESGEAGDDPGSEGPADLTDDELAAHVDAAIRELATAENLDPSQIEVAVAEPITWPDGSLGCPEPDGMYTQALVEGYRIVLDAGGEQVAYHGAAGSDPFRCDRPTDAIIG